MKNFALYIWLIGTALLSFGQEDKAREQIEAARIALITERLSLTPEQAQKFWPIYNEYAKKQEEIRQQYLLMRNKHNPQTASEEENKRMLDLGLKAKEQTVELERVYADRLMQVISTRQLMSLRKAEADFKTMVLKRIREQQQRRELMRQRQDNQQEIQKRRN